MRSKRIKRTSLAAAIVIVALAGAGWPGQAHAGIWDNLKDIYDTPAKVDELQKQYTESIARLEQQQDRLKQDYEQKQAEFEARQQELQRQNEDFRKQNEALAEQNRQLEESMAAARRKQASLKHGIAVAVLVGASALLAYIAAVRVWRYRVYRAQRREQGKAAGL